MNTAPKPQKPRQRKVRMDVRVMPEVKELLNLAAEVSGRSATDIITDAVAKAARQDKDGDVATCYGAGETGTSRIAGYYTLSQYFIGRENLPPEILTKIARYENLPAMLLGRLAVDVVHQGRQLGRALLFDALTRAARLANEISACCVVVDPIDQRAVRFYARNGFEPLAGEVKMFMTMGDIRASVSSPG